MAARRSITRQDKHEQQERKEAISYLQPDEADDDCLKTTVQCMPLPGRALLFLELTAHMIILLEI
ncbi:hypothetical protein BS78_10G263500 [Paspalum vaginatum]|nr:hypothetical protein BS78_10G263500 [Paspalum vaginatum]